MRGADYRRTVEAELTRLGFIGCPLTDEEFAKLASLRFSLDQAVSVASDVAAGFSFAEAIEAAQQ